MLVRLEQQSTVCVIDDDRDVRKGVSVLLRSVGLSSREFGSTAEFLRAEPPDGPCCLILDIRLPALSGLDFQAKLAKTERNMPIVFITGYGDIAMAVKALKHGAVDFLPKPFREQDLLDAVREALDRDKARRDAEKGLADLRARYDTLSKREKMVMSRVCAGFMHKQTAALLAIAEITVKVHRHNVMRKMNAKSLPELVRMGDRLNILAPDQPNQTE